MTDAIARVSLDDAAQKLRDQVKSAFVELLTPEQWQQMVRDILEGFTKPRVLRREYGPAETVPSELEQVCARVYGEHVKALALEELKNQSVWGTDENGRLQIKDLVRDYLNENADKLVRAAIAELLGHGIQEVINNARPR